MIFHVAPWALRAAGLAFGWAMGPLLVASLGQEAAVAVVVVAATLGAMAACPAWHR